MTIYSVCVTLNTLLAHIMFQVIWFDTGLVCNGPVLMFLDWTPIKPVFRQITYHCGAGRDWLRPDKALSGHHMGKYPLPMCAQAKQHIFQP